MWLLAASTGRRAFTSTLPLKIRVGRKRVARLMSAAGLAGVTRRKFVPTTVKGSGRQAPDLVNRNFTAERPNLLWVADITYIHKYSIEEYKAVWEELRLAGLDEEDSDLDAVEALFKKLNEADAAEKAS
jgi:hypothetical protein